MYRAGGGCVQEIVTRKQTRTDFEGGRKGEIQASPYRSLNHQQISSPMVGHIIAAISVITLVERKTAARVM